MLEKVNLSTMLQGIKNETANNVSEYKNFKKCKYMVFAICDSCCSIHNTRIRGRPSTPCLCDLFDKLF